MSFYIVSDKDELTHAAPLESQTGLEFKSEIGGIPYDSLRTTLRSAFTRDSDENRTKPWWQSDGFFLEPGALSVGFHVLQATLFDELSPPPDGLPLQPAAFEIVLAADLYFVE